MSYIFKQKMSVAELVDIATTVNKIIIHEPEEYLSAVYGNYFLPHEFEVRHCPDIMALNSLVKVYNPDLLVFNVDSLNGGDSKLNWLRGFKKNFPQVGVVTTAFNIDPLLLKRLMDLGVSSHLNRKLSRPRDLAIIVTSVLK